MEFFISAQPQDSIFSIVGANLHSTVPTLHRCTGKLVI